MSLGSFPPVQTNKQTALSYGQVGPVAPEIGSSELVSKTAQDAWERLLSILPCPESSDHKHSSYPLVAQKGTSMGEESKMKERKQTLSREGSLP